MTTSHHYVVTLVILAALVGFGPLSIDMYLPSLPTIAQDLLASESHIKLSITLFLTGLSIGMLFYGPLSDKFGRRPLLIGGITLYLLSSLACFFVQSVDMLIWLRLLQAIGGASASVLARAMVRDLYQLNEAAKTLSLMHIVTMIATLVAPLIGSAVLAVLGWRYIFLLLFAFAAITFLLYLKFFEETLPKAAKSPSLAQVFQSYWHIIQQPVAVAYIVCLSITFAAMFVYITASPFVYIQYFGLTSYQYSLLFACNIAAIVLFTSLNARMVNRLGPFKMIQRWACVSLLSGFVLAISVGLHLGGIWMIALSLFVFVGITGSMSANCIAELLGMFKQQAGAASALAIAMQFGLGALMSLLTSALMTDSSPTVMAILILLCTIICMISVGFLSFYRAKR